MITSVAQRVVVTLAAAGRPAHRREHSIVAAQVGCIGVECDSADRRGPSDELESGQSKAPPSSSQHRRQRYQTRRVRNQPHGPISPHPPA